MRILVYISSLGSGGAERVTANLVNYWAEKRWDITVATLAPQSSDFYDLHPSVKRISMDMEGESGNVMAGLWRNLLRVTALRRVLLQTRPEIALGMMSAANVHLALAAWRLPNVRTIGAEHIYPPQVPLGVLWEWLRRFSYGRLVALTALTREGVCWLEANTNARQVTAIPNPAPWPLPGQKPKVNPESVVPYGRKVLLGVGRLDAQKGFDWLLEAFTALMHKYSGWDLVILGEGPLRPSIERQVQASGLGERVFLLGRVGNVGEWYECADLYVMSSRFEGFPNTLAEALAHGLPAVSFDCDTGPRDIIRHEIDGLLVPPGDVTGLALALDRLMGDSDLRECFAKRAVEARERFSLERIAGMWEALFEKVIK